jgi:CheY-like chemotaxis protein
VSDDGLPARILHVDDDEDVLNEVHEYLGDEEILDWGRPEVVGITSFEDALGYLEKERFDLVVLDVRLGSAQEDVDVEDEAGLVALEQIRDRRFVPIVFWTGLPGAIEHLAGELVLVREKTEGLPALSGAVDSLFKTRLPAVNRALLRLVEDEQRRYMWEFVAEHWSELKAVEDHTSVAYLLARRLGRSLSGPGIRQLAKELGEDADSGVPPDGKIHAMEMYLRPPVAGTALEAGDLLRGKDGDEESWSLVLTPSCDLEHGKADYVQLAACLPFADQVDVIAWRSGEGNKGERKAAERRVVEILRQQTGGQLDRWLYLPRALDIPDLIVDMQKLRSVPRAEVDDLQRIASLDSPFAESAINRYNRYYGRVGTPDLDAEAAFERFSSADGEGA